MYFVIFEILGENKVFIVSLLTVEVMYETSIKATIVNENKMKMTMFNVQYVERKCEKKRENTVLGYKKEWEVRMDIIFENFRG